MVHLHLDDRDMPGLAESERRGVIDHHNGSNRRGWIRRNEQFVIWMLGTMVAIAAVALLTWRQVAVLESQMDDLKATVNRMAVEAQELRKVFTDYLLQQTQRDRGGQP